jgi:NAD(P)-dependent dehydrogenase (short-subunit alcohol dehydrogenase family)
MKLNDRVAVVTGAGSGIGRASALAFGKEGAKVVAAEIRGGTAHETVSLIREAKGGALRSGNRRCKPRLSSELSGTDD